MRDVRAAAATDTHFASLVVKNVENLRGSHPLLQAVAEKCNNPAFLQRASFSKEETLRSHTARD